MGVSEEGESELPYLHASMRGEIKAQKLRSSIKHGNAYGDPTATFYQGTLPILVPVRPVEGPGIEFETLSLSQPVHWMRDGQNDLNPNPANQSFSME